MVVKPDKGGFLLFVKLENMVYYRSTMLLEGALKHFFDEKVEKSWENIWRLFSNPLSLHPLSRTNGV